MVWIRTTKLQTTFEQDVYRCAHAIFEQQDCRQHLNKRIQIIFEQQNCRQHLNQRIQAICEQQNNRQHLNNKITDDIWYTVRYIFSNVKLIKVTWNITFISITDYIRFIALTWNITFISMTEYTRFIAVNKIWDL